MVAARVAELLGAPGQSPDSELIDAEEVARILKVRVDYVWVLCRADQIPHQCFGRVKRFRRSAIERWMDRRERGGEPCRRAIDMPAERSAIRPYGTGTVRPRRRGWEGRFSFEGRQVPVSLGTRKDVDPLRGIAEAEASRKLQKIIANYEPPTEGSKITFGDLSTASTPTRSPSAWAPTRSPTSSRISAST